MEGSVSCLLPVALAFLLLFLTWIFVQKKKRQKNLILRFTENSVFSLFFICCVLCILPRLGSLPLLLMLLVHRHFAPTLGIEITNCWFLFRVQVLGFGSGFRFWVGTRGSS